MSSPLSYLIYNPNAEQNGSCSCYRFRNLVRGTRRGSGQGSFRGGRMSKKHFVSYPITPWSPMDRFLQGLTDDGSIPYSTIIQTLSEATANFANLYSKGNAKCRLLTDLLHRPITNLDDFGCPSRESFVPGGCRLQPAMSQTSRQELRSA